MLNFSALLKDYGNILSQFESGNPNVYNKTQLLDQVQKTLKLVKAAGQLSVDFNNRVSSKFSKADELLEQGNTILQALNSDKISPRNIADFARYSYLKARYSKYTDVFNIIERDQV